MKQNPSWQLLDGSTFSAAIEPWPPQEGVQHSCNRNRVINLRSIMAFQATRRGGEVPRGHPHPAFSPRSCYSPAAMSSLKPLFTFGGKNGLNVRKQVYQ